MPTRLKRLQIHKVSLVPRGANPEAHVVLFKSAEPPPIVMSVTTDTTGTSTSYQTSTGHTSASVTGTWGYDPATGMMSVFPFTWVPTVTIKEERSMESKIDRKKLSKEEIEYLDALEAKAASAEPPDPEPKEELPEAVKKMLADQDDLIRKATERAEAAERAAAAEREAREKAEFSKSADKDYTHLPGTAEEKGLVLYAITKKLTEEEVAGVTKLLKAGNEALRLAAIERGSDTPDTSTSVVEKIEHEANEVVKAGKAKTLQQGIDLVLRENPALYNEYRQEVGRRSFTN